MDVLCGSSVTSEMKTLRVVGDKLSSYSLQAVEQMGRTDGYLVYLLTPHTIRSSALLSVMMIHFTYR